ncbi:class I SAM-dependent methyltransferase [Mycobacterium sp. E2733]|uniref:class I SAM-dependent methyltransferase n=1 Tax=Mycobacterium sp. E2733 TaxID=1834138 RepID=UPI0007FF9A53|nr:class I SAM-dependent methyltransferase [Mycobacterium sp. E2733]OBH88803.1 methyltransferase [Mycobacterium sp. E2733]
MSSLSHTQPRNAGTDKIHIDLSGPPQTMLDTLYAKALDADAARPVLGDVYARRLVSQLDYDWDRSAIARQRRRQVASATVRSAQFDVWATEFLALHGRAVVLHLGCGLDSRVFRLNPGPGVDWYDLDYADVIALRKRLYPTRDHYHLVPASATDPSWLAGIPTDRPVLMLAEGLSMYLTADDGLALLRRVVEHFPAGELQLDFWSRLGSRVQQKTNKIVTLSGSRLGWTVQGPDDVLAGVPGARLLAADSLFRAGTVRRLPMSYRFVARSASRIPALRRSIQLHRYAF